MSHLTTKIKHYYRNLNFRSKIFLFFSHFTLLSILALALILIAYYNQNVKKQLTLADERSLRQVQAYCDNQLAEDIYTFLNDKFLLSNTNELIANFFDDNPTPDTPRSLHQLHKELEHLVALYDIYDSVILYRQADDLLISSKQGITLSATSPDNPYRQLLPLSLVQKTLQSEKNPYLISTFENRSFRPSQEIFSYAQSFPLFAPPAKRTGCIIINIDTEKLFATLKQRYALDVPDLMISDPNGRILMSTHHLTSPELITLPTIDSQLLTKILNQPTGQSLDAHQQYSLSWTSSTVNSWKYVSVTPYKVFTHSILVTTKVALAITLLSLFLNLIGIHFISNTLYRPIRQLIQKTDRQLSLPSQHNQDLAYLEEVIGNLSSKVSEMEETLYYQRDLIAHKICADIVSHHLTNLTATNERLQLIQKNFNQPFYWLLFLSLDTNLYPHLPIEQKEFLSYKLIQFIDDFFEDEQTITLSLDQPFGCITTIINTPRTTLDIPQLEAFCKACSQRFVIKLNVAGSANIQSLADINHQFNLLKKSQDYAFIYGYDQIFSAPLLKKYEKNNGPLFRPLKQLESLLLAQNLSDFRKEVTQLIDAIKTEGYSYHYSQSLLLQILNLISTTAKRFDLNLNHEKMMATFFDITSLADCQHWIDNLLNIYQQQLNSLDQKINSDYLFKISQYITEHIDSQLSLTSVARQFHLNPSYLSRLFHDQMKISFSAFVKEKKMEKAAFLLIHQPEIPITHLAEQLGYSTKSYFTKLFKQKYGLTPLQYRKKNQ